MHTPVHHPSVFLSPPTNGVDMPAPPALQLSPPGSEMRPSSPQVGSRRESLPYPEEPIRHSARRLSESPLPPPKPRTSSLQPKTPRGRADSTSSTSRGPSPIPPNVRRPSDAKPPTSRGPSPHPDTRGKVKFAEPKSRSTPTPPPPSITPPPEPLRPSLDIPTRSSLDISSPYSEEHIIRPKTRLFRSSFSGPRPMSFIPRDGEMGHLKDKDENSGGGGGETTWPEREVEVKSRGRVSEDESSFRVLNVKRFSGVEAAGSDVPVINVSPSEGVEEGKFDGRLTDERFDTSPFKNKGRAGVMPMPTIRSVGEGSEEGEGMEGGGVDGGEVVEEEMENEEGAGDAIEEDTACADDISGKEPNPAHAAFEVDPPTQDDTVIMETDTDSLLSLDSLPINRTNTFRLHRNNTTYSVRSFWRDDGSVIVGGDVFWDAEEEVKGDGEGEGISGEGEGGGGAREGNEGEVEGDENTEKEGDAGDEGEDEEVKGEEGGEDLVEEVINVDQPEEAILIAEEQDDTSTPTPAAEEPLDTLNTNTPPPLTPETLEEEDELLPLTTDTILPGAWPQHPVISSLRKGKYPSSVRSAPSAIPRRGLTISSVSTRASTKSGEKVEESDPEMVALARELLEVCYREAKAERLMSVSSRRSAGTVVRRETKGKVVEVTREIVEEEVVEEVVEEEVDEIVTCPICVEDYPLSKGYIYHDGCPFGTTCSGCAVEYVRNCLGDVGAQFPIKCPLCLSNAGGKGKGKDNGPALADVVTITNELVVGKLDDEGAGLTEAECDTVWKHTNLKDLLLEQGHWFCPKCERLSLREDVGEKVERCVERGGSQCEGGEGGSGGGESSSGGAVAAAEAPEEPQAAAAPQAARPAQPMDNLDLLPPTSSAFFKKVCGVFLPTRRPQQHQPRPARPQQLLVNINNNNPIPIPPRIVHPRIPALKPLSKKQPLQNLALVDSQIQCPYCFYTHCDACNNPWHPFKPCAIDTPAAVAATLSEIDATSKACPNCSLRITHYKDHGCHSIICPKCRTDFCYVCLAKGGGHGSCGCKVWCCETGARKNVPLGPGCRCPICPECEAGGRCAVR
ncbi:hypothetical protein HDV00_007185 [Rhizophlyctis rosea]|nr:hypothetical protein HDV00_007185 [Rhizophlyctis rosea]